jgi:predicted signal transduction protein with EAL and GGDEF domain
VVVPDSQIPGNVSMVVERIADAFSRPFYVRQSEHSIASSIGLARFPEHSREAAQLIRFADIAMYSAKRNKRAFAEFNDLMREDIVFRSDVAREFRSALKEGQFYLAFQPRVKVADGEIVGLEALARWHHPRHGEVPPSRFIPILEETGLIREFGRWAISTVCTQLKTWRAEGIRPIRVAVNVSQRQLQDAGFAGVVRDSLSRAEVAA